MNYSAIYDSLIQKYGTWKKPSSYTERHRKLPGCLGGEYVEGNAFYLPARVHFICHLLLVKMYPDNPRVTHAAFRMSNWRIYGTKEYAWLKEKWAAHMREVMRTGANPMKDPKHVAKISGEYSPTKREDVRGKIAASRKGKTASNRTKEKMSAASKGKPKTLEHNAAVSKAKTGVPNPQKKYACECGYVSTGSGIFRHQRATNHQGKEYVYA